MRAAVTVPIVILSTVIAMSGCARDPEVPIQRWMRGAASETYRPPDPTEQRALSVAFADALAGVPARVWQAFGYESRSQAGQLAVREAAPAHRGWGAYAFRGADARPLLIQAPHVESDRHSGEIAFAIYEHARGRAVGFNSAHRSLPEADQAASPDGPFVLMTHAALRADPSMLVVQVHGFGTDTARRYGLDPATAVVSNGTRVRDDATRHFASCLRAAGFDARLFPEKAAFPGGTRNAVGAAVRRSPAARFLHLELGSGLRAELLAQPDRVEELAACL